jgi:hypothetical protein
MFVCALVRVSECESLPYCMLGMCVVCSFSRVLPIVFPVVMCVYFFGVFELSLHMKGGETEVLIRLFYPYFLYWEPMSRGP